MTKAQLSGETDSVIFENTSKLISATATNKLFKDIIEFIPTAFNDLSGASNCVSYFDDNGVGTTDQYFKRDSDSFFVKTLINSQTTTQLETSKNLTLISDIYGTPVKGSSMLFADLGNEVYAYNAVGIPTGASYPFGQIVAGNATGSANMLITYDTNENHGWQIGSVAENDTSNLKALYNISSGPYSAQGEMEIWNRTTNQKANVKVLFSSATLYCSASGGTAGMSVEVKETVIRIGSVFSGGNGTEIVIDDLTQLVKITNVPTYADDAAAISGGLISGNLYKTTTLGSTFLKILP